MLTRLKIAQVPPSSLFARCCLIYLKYTYSRNRKTAAKRIPIISRRNALRNCSSASGSLLFCTSLPGLHVPVIQYLLNRSRSPGIDRTTCRWTSRDKSIVRVRVRARLTKWALSRGWLRRDNILPETYGCDFACNNSTVVSVVQQSFVEHLQVLGVPGERDAVAGHGVPGANRQQTTILVLGDQVVQDRAVVNERVHVSAEHYNRILAPNLRGYFNSRSTTLREKVSQN